MSLSANPPNEVYTNGIFPQESVVIRVNTCGATVDKALDNATFQELVRAFVKSFTQKYIYFGPVTIQIPFKGNNYNLYNVEGWAIKPRNNQLLLFPSQLRHEVYPNESDTERYCIAFNFFAFGKFGYDDQVQLGIKDVTRD